MSGEEVGAKQAALVATPNPDNVIESLMTDCTNCGQPVVSVKLNAGSEWSDWAHALTGQVACMIGAPDPPPATQRGN